MRNKSFNVKTDKEIKDEFTITKLNGHVYNELEIRRIVYHRIFLIKNGKGTIHIDGVDFQLSENELYLLSAGQLFAFHAGTEITGFEVIFGDFFWAKTPSSASDCKAALFNNINDHQQLKLKLNEYSAMCLLFEVLFKEKNKNHYSNKLELMAAYFKIIMIKITNVSNFINRDYDVFENQLYQKFIRLVYQEYQTTHEVAAFSSKLGISAKKLTEVCKRCVGRGAKDIINMELITEAKRSLQFSSKPINEIALDLNFSTSGQFSAFFKKYALISPNEYRSLAASPSN